jgi:hypothetical protein
MSIFKYLNLEIAVLLNLTIQYESGPSAVQFH